jgi:hypothetical protein
MQDVTVAARAIFTKLKPSCRVLLVFGCGVRTLLALGARQGNNFIFFLRTHLIDTPFRLDLIDL